LIQYEGRPSTILLVEDETFIRLMLVEELESHGHTVIEAADADAALSVLRENTSVGLLFTDIKMPGTIDGLELARFARAEHPDVKIIIASAHVGLPEWSSEAHAAFAKPYDLQRVIARIDQLLRPEGDEPDHL
jgi:CheY-like chemotaxis protein